MTNLNEFRKDLVSGDWVLFATGRAGRPGNHKNGPALTRNKSACPFENPEKSGNEVLKTYDGNEAWFAKVAKNKFPAVMEGEAGTQRAVGPFAVTDAKGLHEIVIYREHDRELYQYSPAELGRVFAIYQERYRVMADYISSKYILIFHNQGASAGASIAHPHSQIISIPILPPDVKRSLYGAENFYKKNNKRVYDLMIDWEMKENKRIVYETKNFIAFCPFVSKTPYEVRIFSKESHAHFEQCPAELLPELGEAMGAVLKKIHAALNDPDFNFFIHTAPVYPEHNGGEENSPTAMHEFYSWHIEIIPKVKMEGAFELGSGVEVNIIDPDRAAAELKNAQDAS